MLILLRSFGIPACLQAARHRNHFEAPGFTITVHLAETKSRGEKLEEPSIQSLGQVVRQFLGRNNPVGVGFHLGTHTQGSSFLATLGCRPMPFGAFDSRRLEIVARRNIRSTEFRSILGELNLSLLTSAATSQKLLHLRLHCCIHQRRPAAFEAYVGVQHLRDPRVDAEFAVAGKFAGGGVVKWSATLRVAAASQTWKTVDDFNAPWRSDLLRVTDPRSGARRSRRFNVR